MTLTYRFRSWFWFLVMLPVAGVSLYDLVCRLGFACNAAWPQALQCPASGIISCNGVSPIPCLFFKLVMLLVSATILSYRKRVTIDGDTLQLTTAATFFGYALSTDTRSMAHWTRITLAARTHDSGFRIKGTKRDIRVTSYFLRFTGETSGTIHRFGTRWYARRIGRAIAAYLQLPFVDTSAKAVGGSAQSD